LSLPLGSHKFPDWYAIFHTRNSPSSAPLQEQHQHLQLPPVNTCPSGRFCSSSIIQSPQQQNSVPLTTFQNDKVPLPNNNSFLSSYQFNRSCSKHPEQLICDIEENGGFHYHKLQKINFNKISTCLLLQATTSTSWLERLLASAKMLFRLC
jgi:hypothetical protein